MTRLGIRLFSPEVGLGIGILLFGLISAPCPDSLGKLPLETELSEHELSEAYSESLLDELKNRYPSLAEGVVHAGEKQAFQFLLQVLDSSPVFQRTASLPELLKQWHDWGGIPHTAEDHHPFFRIHPELFRPLLFSLPRLYRAARSDQHPEFGLEQFYTALELSLSKVTETQRFRRRDLKKLTELGHLIELVAAAHFVASNFEILLLQTEAMILGERTEIDILVRSRNATPKKILVEVKTSLTGLHKRAQKEVHPQSLQFERLNRLASQTKGNRSASLDEIWVFVNKPITDSNREIFERDFPFLELQLFPEHLRLKHLLPSLGSH